MVGNLGAALGLERAALQDTSETSTQYDPKAALRRNQLSRMYSLKAFGTRFKEREVEKEFKLSQAKANCQVKPARALTCSRKTDASRLVLAD